MVMTDAISRHIKGMLKNDVNKKTEIFTNNLLKYPQRTRTERFIGVIGSEGLLSEHHTNNLFICPIVMSYEEYKKNSRVSLKRNGNYEYCQNDLSIYEHM